ncbi:MAG: hypothetical protein R3C45_14170 [Phycisphaerales bacterium]
MPTYIAAAVIVLLGYVLIPIVAGLWVGKRIRLPESYPTIRRGMGSAPCCLHHPLFIYTLIGLLVVDDPVLGVATTLRLDAGPERPSAGPVEMLVRSVAV